MEHFLIVRNLNNVVLYTCWPLTGDLYKLLYHLIFIVVTLLLLLLGRIKIMKKFNQKGIAVTYRNRKDFHENYNLKDIMFMPLLGVIVDWSCNEYADMLFNVGT